MLKLWELDLLPRRNLQTTLALVSDRAGSGLPDNGLISRDSHTWTQHICSSDSWHYKDHYLAAVYLRLMIRVQDLNDSSTVDLFVIVQVLQPIPGLVFQNVLAPSRSSDGTLYRFPMLDEYGYFRIVKQLIQFTVAPESPLVSSRLVPIIILVILLSKLLTRSYSMFHIRCIAYYRIWLLLWMLPGVPNWRIE